MLMPSTRWLKSLWKLRPKASPTSDSKSFKKTILPSFSIWRRKSTVSVREDDDETAADVPQPAATRPTLAEMFAPPKVQAPVAIPIEYLCQTLTFVGGKKIPYTRHHARMERRRMIVFDRIPEDKPFLLY
ncbi:unnamed protein product [Aphanomyces euteiches]|uniref:Uncharacterized protein n=1 Tax=Aphanomyces euteiches TaxID=100861 RepID=A0A6G0X5D6_9STRA|nr:hypothetical protein Ae201684_008341 [Aphanomyces euteiches]KAH9070196.1 hypothetical protein Ae201684P_002564 [Aphanomyces euteiches]KAH9157416.1 hypothetical protein AeRB84_000720 [Aphanomyces euteiches]